MSEVRKKRPLPHGWRWARLGDVCELNPRRRQDKRIEQAAPTTFVPMSAVDDQGGRILAPLTRPYHEVAKGYTYFEEGDVLFAKITPCMENGKSAIATGLLGGFGLGSTEFHVLRPGASLCAEWVHLFLRRPAFRQEASKYMTGAVGQQRVPEQFLTTTYLPLPPLYEQHSIAARLSEQMAQVERMREAAKVQMETTRALKESLLYEVYESEEAARRPRKKLEEVCQRTIEIRNPLKRPEKTFFYVDISSVDNETKRIVKTEKISGENAPSRAKQVIRFNDVLISTTRPNLNCVCLVPHELDDQICSTGYCILRSNPFIIEPIYLFYFLQSPYFVDSISGLVKGSLYPAITDSQVFELTIPLPPIEDQRRITDLILNQMNQVKPLLSMVHSQLDTINALPAALLEEVFGGFEPPA